MSVDSTRGKKSKISVASEMQLQPMFRQRRGFPLGGSDRFASLFAVALNSNSALQMRQMLHESLVPLSRVTKYLQRRSAQGTASTDMMTFSNSDEFFAYNDQFAAFVQGVINTKSISAFTHPTKGTTIISVNFSYDGVFIVPSAAGDDSEGAVTTVPDSETIYLDERPSGIGIHANNDNSDDLTNCDSISIACDSDGESIADDPSVHSDPSISSEEEPTVLDESIGPTHTASSEEAIEEISTTSTLPSATVSHHAFSANGSYMLYLNEDHRIHAMEFFYAFNQ